MVGSGPQTIPCPTHKEKQMKDVNSFTNSQETLRYLQGKYGSANYASWQSLRRQFYSEVTYPEAGVTELNFFGTPKGQSGNTFENTNMIKANSFGQQHFLLKSIHFNITIATWAQSAFSGTDTASLYSDIVNGFVHHGVFTLMINAKTFAQIPKPFLYCPPGTGQPVLKSAAIKSMVLAEAAPNTLSVLTGPTPQARLLSRDENNYILDPQILIEAEQTFEAKLTYNSGAIAVIGTGITDDSTNPLKVRVTFDGIVFRPVQ
jgi:hypothetical protein